MNAKSAKILLVDDNAELLAGPARALENAGYRIITAQSGKVALGILRTELPDLVLLDRDMPDMDGVEVCRQIKKDPAIKDVMVVFFSGVYTLSRSQASGLDAGADGYITRPIRNRELIEQVETFLGSRVQRDSAKRE